MGIARIIFRRRRAFSMVEATLSTVIVSGLLVAAMSNVASSRLVRGRMADRMRGQQLAMDLMAEILQQSYADPSSPESGRAAWTDVDDYNGLLDSPPATKSGTALANCTGWSRNVLVQSIDPTSLAVTSNTNTGIKQVTVTVFHGTLLVATVAAYRTAGWADTVPNPSSTTSEHPPVASATGSPLSGSGGQLTVHLT